VLQVCVEVQQAPLVPQAVVPKAQPLLTQAPPAQVWVAFSQQAVPQAVWVPVQVVSFTQEPATQVWVAVQQVPAQTSWPVPQTLTQAPLEQFWLASQHALAQAILPTVQTVLSTQAVFTQDWLAVQQLEPQGVRPPVQVPLLTQTSTLQDCVALLQQVAPQAVWPVVQLEPTHMLVVVLQVLGKVHGPQGWPQASSPHSWVPQPQVLHTPLTQLSPLPQHLVPQAWAVGQTPASALGLPASGVVTSVPPQP